MEYTFYIQDFWTTCACPEKQRVPWIHCIECIFFSGFLSNLRLPWKFSLYWICIFYCSGVLSNLRLPWKQSCPGIFHCIEYTFYIQRFLSNLRLPWKTEGALNLLYWMYIFYYSKFLSNLRLPWNFSLYWNIFYYSGFLRNLRLPWKQSLPWKFSSPGGQPPPPPRTPMLADMRFPRRFKQGCP